MDKLFWVCILVTLLGFVASAVDPIDVIKTAVDDVENDCTDTAQTVNCDAAKQAVDNAGTDLEAVCVLVESYTECMGRKCDDTATFRDAVEAIEAPCAEDSKDGNDSGSDFLRPAFLVMLLPVAMLNLI